MCTLFLDGIFLIFVSFFQVLLSTLFVSFFWVLFFDFSLCFLFCQVFARKKDTVAFSFTYKKTTVSFFKSVSGTAPGSSPLLF